MSFRRNQIANKTTPIPLYNDNNRNGRSYPYEYFGANECCAILCARTTAFDVTRVFQTIKRVQNCALCFPTGTCVHVNIVEC